MCTLSADQAFQAMRCFLAGYFERTRSDEVGALLGDLQVSEDGKPFDPAAWDDWLDAVKQTLEEVK